MVTQAQCKTYAADYRRLGRATEISVQRATILVAISRSWTILGSQLGHLADIEAEEKLSRISLGPRKNS
jgi:hypothetical protein